MSAGQFANTWTRPPDLVIGGVRIRSTSSALESVAAIMAQASVILLMESLIIMVLYHFYGRVVCNISMF
jgi:hypothetical protein